MKIDVHTHFLSKHIAQTLEKRSDFPYTRLVDGTYHFGAENEALRWKVLVGGRRRTGSSMAYQCDFGAENARIRISPPEGLEFNKKLMIVWSCGGPTDISRTEQ